MSIGQARPANGPGLLRWGVRTYAALILCCIALVTVALPWLLRQRDHATFEARALVVAQTFEVPLEALPRYSEAVFFNGAVARRAALTLGFDGDPDSLVPDRVAVVTAQDSVAMTVIGRDGDASVAAQIANDAANTYVTELNRPGPELGVFTLQSAAAPPAAPLETVPGPAATYLVGGVAGLALGLGLTGVLLSVRRPLVDDAHVESVVGAPVLGLLELPTRFGRLPDVRQVAGLPPLVRRLADLPAGRVLVVSPPEGARARKMVTTLLTTALARWRPSPLDRVPGAGRGQSRPVSGDDGTPGPSVTIVDVAAPLDTGPDAAGATTLLVLPEGAAERKVQRLVADYADVNVTGVILVRTRGYILGPGRLRARPEVASTTGMHLRHGTEPPDGDTAGVQSGPTRAVAG